jgi:flavin-binding protein dodecin
VSGLPAAYEGMWPRFPVRAMPSNPDFLCDVRCIALRPGPCPVAGGKKTAAKRFSPAQSRQRRMETLSGFRLVTVESPSMLASSDVGIACDQQKERGSCSKGKPMKNHVYKLLEIVGSSETSIEDAISTAVTQASKTVRHMDWFEVVETRGHIENGKIGHYQVTLKIGFGLES